MPSAIAWCEVTASSAKAMQGTRTDIRAVQQSRRDACDNRSHYYAVPSRWPKKNCKAGVHAVHSHTFGLADEAARFFPGMERWIKEPQGWNVPTRWSCLTSG
jgi:hypothetical protein